MKKDLPETVEVPTEDIIEWAFENVNEHGEFDFPTMDGVDSDQFFDGIHPSNATDIEIHDNGVIVYGRFSVHEAVGRIPAGPNRGYGPINPPETITEKREMAFDLFCPWSLYDVAAVHVEWY
ncbi:hypothetical protein [Halorubrum sp. LN27]|uniref:hypothetical protein n=1 Tax=Halorubrum sp. LN27 TaxID=2801032 RepID=UPI00190C6CCA|nr:hypothetical protein [Halorubrum sp. LN27]